jgi:hypothetical protein
MSEQRTDAAGDGTGAVTVGELRRALSALNWSAGLTRDHIRRKWRRLPQAIYLRLPSSKRYYSPGSVMYDAEIAASRAEGDFLGPTPDLPEDESLDEGGPPAWGPDPIFTPGGAVDSGSAEDRTTEEASD